MTKKNEKKYPVGDLLKSRMLSGYQPDFAKAILKAESYGKAEALELLNKNLNRKECK